jgi:hypothetical protein
MTNKLISFFWYKPYAAITISALAFIVFIFIIIRPQVVIVPSIFINDKYPSSAPFKIQNNSVFALKDVEAALELHYLVVNGNRFENCGNSPAQAKRIIEPKKSAEIFLVEPNSMFNGNIDTADVDVNLRFKYLNFKRELRSSFYVTQTAYEFRWIPKLSKKKG